MTDDEAWEFATGWAKAWNSHDLEAILGHFREDVEFRSPLAADLVPGSAGTILGKDALRAYWRTGLERLPDLHFELLGVYPGVDAVIIHYRNQAGRSVCEFLEFDAERVIRGHGCYAAPAATPPTAAP